MSDTIQRMGILTGGGDCPGLNAVIRAAVKTAINEYGWEVLGIEDGFEGLIQPNKARLLDMKMASRGSFNRTRPGCWASRTYAACSPGVARCWAVPIGPTLFITKSLPMARFRWLMCQRRCSIARGNTVLMGSWLSEATARCTLRIS